MQDRIDHPRLKADLLPPRTIAGVMLAMLAIYIIICHSLGKQFQQPLPEDQRILIRTVLYGIAIVTFPLTNLIRHIQLRLNQTMPLARTTHGKTDTPVSAHEAFAVAKTRYFITALISMTLIESIGIFGFVMFVLGDSFNTLYIFTGMSALGLFLYRPKLDEYNGIIEALIHAER